jgi:hypothetical protein
MRYLPLLFMVVAFGVQVVGGYSPVSFACGILFGGCFTMMLTVHFMRKVIRGDDSDHQT